MRFTSQDAHSGSSLPIARLRVLQAERDDSLVAQASHLPLRILTPAGLPDLLLQRPLVSANVLSPSTYRVWAAAPRSSRLFHDHLRPFCSGASSRRRSDNACTASARRTARRAVSCRFAPERESIACASSGGRFHPEHVDLANTIIVGNTEMSNTLRCLIPSPIANDLTRGAR